MRIAHLIGSLLVPLGGAEQYTLELARAQHEAGDEVTILTGWISPEVAASLEADGVAVEIVRSRRPHAPDRRGSRPAAVLFHGLDLLDSLRAPRALRAAARRDWDVVHAHRLAGIGAGALRAATAPVLVTVHDYSLVDTRSNTLRRGVPALRPPLVQRLRTRVISRALRNATVIFPDERLRRRHREWGLRAPARSVVIPHGWRLGAPAVGTRQASRPVLLFLGKLLETKGVRLLLDAWGDGIAGAELWIAGTGPLEPLVAEAAARGRVRQLGWLDTAGRDAALAAATALVLPSTGPEIFLLAAAEGALAGLPVVSTTVAAPPAVRDGESGILVAPDAAALRAGMERVLDPGVHAVLASGARDLAADLDFDVHVAKLRALWAPALEPVP